MKIKFVQDFIDIVRGKKGLFPKQNIQFLVFWVGTKCTLKCKNCCNLIPYVKQSSFDYIENLKDLDFIAKNANINVLQIQGGEPFTHPNIDKIIDYACDKKFNRIEIATNATKILNEKSIKILKKVCSNENVVLRISNYRCAEKLREKFVSQLDANNISYEMYSFMYGNDTWFNTGGINEKRADTKQTIINFHKCDEKNCQTLVDGKLEFCGKIHAIKELYNCKDTKNYSEINIRKIRKQKLFKNLRLRFELKKFYSNNKFKEQCRYCKVTDEKVPAAIQLTAQELMELKCQK